ncbi:mRNA splicing factor PRL1 (nucleomorph) [Bigelowiella natans]|uniref:mRNA splicing factor PRL1 n=1 Tax=Bigelowiella natans TaxID=227086 RepID=Q3LW47_BIGNA|nr:mRNA splicing factor PRL1 [Bigelowiella natans]ABA27318.1 mRNA splicing factor PRL1 [Bigelowiella natans]
MGNHKNNKFVIHQKIINENKFIMEKNSRQSIIEKILSIKKNKCTSNNDIKRKILSNVIRKQYHDKTQKKEMAIRFKWKIYNTIFAHLGWVRSIDFNYSNSLFFTGSSDRTIKIWNFPKGRLLSTLPGHIDQITDILVDQDQDLLYSASLDKTIKCWDLKQNRVINQYYGHKSGVYTINLFNPLKILFSGGRDCVIKVWDTRSNKEVNSMRGHENTIMKIISDRKNPKIISTSIDRTIKFWDLRTAKCTGSINKFNNALRDLKLSNDGFIYGVSIDLFFKVKNSENNKIVTPLFNLKKSFFTCIDLSKKGIILTGTEDGFIFVWHKFKQKLLNKLDVNMDKRTTLDEKNSIIDIKFDRTGSRFISSDTSRCIKLWHQRSPY